ncbi:MAG: peptidase [Ignavibacteriaceae bacterium]|nr:peptidase [Ignavibacteriaceae bacterium]
MLKKTYFFIIVIISILSTASFSQISSNSDLLEWLKSVPGIEIKEVSHNEMFKEAYEIMIEQPIDHFNPNSGTFKQQIFLSHVDRDLPLVFDTEGYGANNWVMELTKILNCNQIVAEHRYFGESVPEPFDWKFLNIRQAAADHHRIVEIFKKYYKGKWITTGISKGGSTVIFHRRFYPDDVDVSVPYVGPVNFSTEDQRVYEFIKNVSNQKCRDKVKNFQITVLKNRDKLFPMFKESAEKDSLTYSIVGIERAFEYVVLEYSFAYWQWSDGDCMTIPDSTSDIDKIFDHLKAYSPFDYFSDSGIKSIWPFFYQCYTEYGYYAYDIDPFKKYLKHADGLTRFFIPEGVNPVFDPEPMKDINKYVQNEADNFIFIYGGNDPWTSTSVCLTGKTNSIKMILPGGSHRTRIRDFSGDDKELIYSKLEDWLGIKIVR